MAEINKLAIYLLAGLVVISLAWLMYGWIAATPRVGPVGSTHIHHDFKVYLNGEAIDFSQRKYQVRSPYIHVEDNDGDVIHTHATGVTLGMFFDSLGMRLTPNCFSTDYSAAFCNDGGKTLKFYTNGQPNADFGNYTVRNLDKILISFGDENESALQAQLNSITDKAKTALKPRG